MSDDEGPEYDEGELPPIVNPDGEPEIDKDGYPISRGGKFQAQLNPLQQKLEREKREREERAAKEAKKAALASKLAAFGGAKKEDPAEKAARERAEAEAKAAAEKAAKAAKLTGPAQIDSRVADMMKSESWRDPQRGTGTRWSVLHPSTFFPPPPHTHTHSLSYTGSA
jgi:hypothetical protein